MTVYSKLNNDTKTPLANLYRKDDGSYWLEVEGHPKLALFKVPTESQVLGTCKATSKKPPTIYIIFRGPVQKCLKDLNFKFERKVVSKISSNLWKRIDLNLRKTFENLYRDTSEQWRKGRLIIEFFNPLTESSTNEEHPTSDLAMSVELKPKLSREDEQRVARELFGSKFFGWGYIPDYNKYL